MTGHRAVRMRATGLAVLLAVLLCPRVDAQSFTTGVAERCRTDLWNINHVAGWQVQWPSMAAAAPVDTPEDRAAALERWSAFPDALDQEIQTLRKGLREGFSAPRHIVDRARAQLATLLAHSEEESPLWSPARRADDEAFRDAWDALVREQIVPSIKKFVDFLTDTYRTAAREEIGLHAVPNGRLCYAHTVERWTTLQVSPEALKRIGEEQLSALRDELDAVAAEHFETTAEALMRRFRSGDIPDPFQTERDVLDHARATVSRARAALPQVFAKVPEADVVVEPMPPHQAEGGPAGFYLPPSGSRANGVFLVNTTRPAQRRIMAEAITIHETLPGHHLQMALGASGQPYNAGFAEGWAIYAERLADEIGLYSTPLDRAGMLVKHMWAASRLLVDPGIHVFEWTRQDAIDSMRAHTALPLDEIEAEVDRYIALPGQSLSYILGYLEIRRLRTEAEQALGDAFDIRAFHHAVLTNGFVELAELEESIRAWVRTAR